MTPRVFLLGLLAGAGCRPAEPPADTAAAPPWQDAAPHSERFVNANDVRLHVLDWGGTGPALVLIHGYGDSPHIFDDFVPALGGECFPGADAARAQGRRRDPHGPGIACDLHAGVARYHRDRIQDFSEGDSD